MLRRVAGFIIRITLGKRRASNWYIRYKQGKIIRPRSKEPLTPAKRKWLESKPRKELTWGVETKGDDFIKKISRYYQFDNDVQILEIGPSLGRLLKSIIRKKIRFRTFLGLDITRSNVEYLKETFVNQKVQFIEGNPESIVLDRQFDVVISSLTFKHFMPTFELVLYNISKYLKKNGMIFFDLDEDTSNNEVEDQTYTGQYTKKTVTEIMQRCGIILVGFDEVTHVKERKGLLVIGKR